MSKVSEYGIFSGPNTGKYGPEKTSYLDTFHEVIYFLIKFDMKKPKQSYFIFLQLKVQPCILQKNVTKRIKIKF